MKIEFLKYLFVALSKKNDTNDNELFEKDESLNIVDMRDKNINNFYEKLSNLDILLDIIIVNKIKEFNRIFDYFIKNSDNKNFNFDNFNLNYEIDRIKRLKKYYKENKIQKIKITKKILLLNLLSYYYDKYPIRKEEINLKERIEKMNKLFVSLKLPNYYLKDIDKVYPSFSNFEDCFLKLIIEKNK